MYADGHDASGFCGFRIEAVESINAALEEYVGFVMVRDHHRDVVDLRAIRNGEDWTAGGFGPQRLIVEYPIAKPCQAAFGDVIKRMVCLTAAGTKPPRRPFPGKRLYDVERFSNHGALVLDLLDRHLHVAVRHELPSGIARRSRHLR